MNTTLPTEAEIYEWQEPDLMHLDPKLQKEYSRRKSALMAVIRGKSILSAAKDHFVNRKTLTKMIHDCVTVAPDGQTWQWRVCIPNRARTSQTNDHPKIPESPKPGAFGKLLAALPDLVVLLASFTKPLPSRERRSTAFEKFLEKFLQAIRVHSNGKGYPFNSPDKGRRSIIEHIRKHRRSMTVEQLCVENEDQSQSKQLKQVFEFNVMERLEFDAHRLDADFSVEIEDSSGVAMIRPVNYIWLLLVIDSVSRLAIGWSLVIGRGYSQVDVLRVFMRALIPWEPRDLLSEEMCYVPGSGIGTIAATGRLLRGIISAADNALAHHAKLTTSNIITRFKGVFSLGNSKVPEIRGILEALFKKLENGAIRHFPGGFEPSRDRDTPKRATTRESSKSHPLNIVALHDLMDVIIAGYNATPLPALGDRSPLDIVRHHTNAGGWSFESSISDKDANRLTQMRFPIRIKANKKEGRQPFVNFLRARYRAHGLTDRWDLANETFHAVASFEDLRYINVLNKNGDLFVRLHALPPWSKTKHDLDLRKLINRWTNRGLFTINGVDDAVAAYRKFVRKNIISMPGAVDQTVKYPQHHKRSMKKPASVSAVFTPRDGLFSFDDSKDPCK